ncbi:uncharacterized protein CMU_009710 [Cryptosporidium muris RN66]|uniref:Uncharacterized protein n=1 Tax=Cryptosporidium muris (strain RN66) TaxID=441375 RepID=B6AE38_CRYMR|nr:uncharacterized protein CMU_009710 [Cryptosporidium muris RN66]EEA06479.1 hypothetical protein, conserved [Cryptosporidium muris RN66]|eukprot:XP_002140828.1 hypothetical protein [Cryptosporidium muris RN66]
MLEGQELLVNEGECTLGEFSGTNLSELCKNYELKLKEYRDNEDNTKQKISHLEDTIRTLRCELDCAKGLKVYCEISGDTNDNDNYNENLNKSAIYNSKKDMENEISILTQQLAHERTENERLQLSLRSLQDSLVESKQEILACQQRVYESEIISSKAQHDLNMVNLECSSFKDINEKLKNEISSLENRIKELHDSKNTLVLENSRRMSVLEISERDLEYRISIIQKNKEELEIEYTRLNEELRRIKAEFEFSKGHYEGKLKIKEESLKLKDEQLSQMKNLLDTSINTTETLESELNKLKQQMTEIDNINNNISNLDYLNNRKYGNEKKYKLSDSEAVEFLCKLFGEESLNRIQEESNNINVESGREGRRMIIDLLTELEECQRNYEESRNKILFLQEELKECQSNMKITLPEIEGMRKHLENLQVENSCLLQQLHSLSQDNRELLHNISEYKSLWQHETNTRDIFENRCRELTEQLSNLMFEFEHLRNIKISEYIEENSLDCKNIDFNKNNLSKNIYEDVMEQNIQLKLQISRLIDGNELESQIQVRKLNVELSNCTNKLEEIYKERDELVSQYQTLINKLENELTSLKEKERIREERDQNIIDEKMNNKESDNLNNSNISSLNNSSHTMRQLTDITEICKSLSEKLTSEIETSSQYRSELSRIKAQCEYLENLKTRTEKKMDELFEERDVLYKKINDFRKIELSKDMELENIQEVLKTKQAHLSDIERENENLRKTIGNLNSCVLDLKGEIEMHIKQKGHDNAFQRDVISKLQAELEGKCIEINTLRKSQDKILQREFEESLHLRQKLRSQSQRCNELEVSIKALKDRLRKKEETSNIDLNTDYIKSPTNIHESEDDNNNLEISQLSTPELTTVTTKISLKNSIGSSNNLITSDIDDNSLENLKASLEESRKLQAYWKELIQSTEKQLENKIVELEESRKIQENLSKELEKIKNLLKEEENIKLVEINKYENRISQLSEDLAVMTTRVSSVDEEIMKREDKIRKQLESLENTNLGLCSEIQQLRQTETDLRSQYQNIVRSHSVDVERLQNVNKQLITLKEEMANLTEKYKKSETEHTELIMELQNEVEQFRRQLETSAKQCDKLKNQNIDYRNIIRNIKSEKEKYESNENYTEEQINLRKIEDDFDLIGNINFSNNLDEKDDIDLSQISYLVTSEFNKSSSKTVSLVLSRRVRDLTTNLEEMDTKLNECKIEIQKLTFERKSLKEENEVLQNRLTEEIQRVSEFACKAEANETALTRLGELVTLRETNDRLRRELLNLTERYNGLEKHLEAETRQYDPLRCEITQLKAEVENLKLECNEKSTVAKSWEEQYNRILATFDNIDPNEIKILKNDIDKLTEANRILQANLTEKSQQLEKLSVEKQNEHTHQEELQSIKQQMEQLRKVYMSTNQKLKEERDKTTKLEKDLKNISKNTISDISQVQPSQLSTPANNNTQSVSLSSVDIRNISAATSKLSNAALKLAKICIISSETSQSEVAKYKRNNEDKEIMDQKVEVLNNSKSQGTSNSNAIFTPALKKRPNKLDDSSNKVTDSNNI